MRGSPRATVLPLWADTAEGGPTSSLPRTECSGWTDPGQVVRRGELGIRPHGLAGPRRSTGTLGMLILGTVAKRRVSGLPDTGPLAAVSG